MTAKYHQKDIGNCDAMVSFSHAQPTKPLCVKSESRHSDIFSKERLRLCFVNLVMR